jgi:hypothetical protein
MTGTRQGIVLFPIRALKATRPSPQRLRHVGMEEEPPCFLARTFRRSVLSAPVAESPCFTPYPNTHTQGFISPDTISTNKKQAIIAMGKLPRALRRRVEVIPLGGGENASIICLRRFFGYWSANHGNTEHVIGLVPEWTRWGNESTSRVGDEKNLRGLLT